MFADEIERKKIGKRTIFNLIGPLSSPAKVNRQIVGVFDKKLLRTFADALKNLNIKFAWIVNSEDGLDEISPFAKTNIVELKNNSIKEFSIDPKDLKININNFENIIGKDAEYNSKKIEEIRDALEELEKAINDIKEKWKEHMKKEKTIQIIVQGGVVVDVKNLPDGYVVQIVDKDVS